MIKRISAVATTLVFYALTAGSAWAQAGHSNGGGNGRGNAFGHGNGNGNGNGHVASVPEIDAASGMLALAAVAAMIALFYELRRRRIGED